MKRLLDLKRMFFAASALVLAVGPSFGGWTFDEKTGALGAVTDGEGRLIASRVVSRYTLMAKSGDVEAVEEEDVVVRRETQDGATVFTCTNPKMPGVTVRKRYWKENGGLRRELTFENANAESRYVTPFVECHLAPAFQKGVYHLGAGYIGPYKPFPTVDRPRPVNEYRQSSKGLVFIRPSGDRSNFSHYRVKIDDTVVWPWFHSTIGHYREYHDRLWYLPDGYRMGLGTFGLYRGRPVSVTEQFNFFDGNLFSFFDDVFAKDPDVAAELASIPSAPDWIQNLSCIVWNIVEDDFVRWLGETLDAGEILACACLFNSWGDYRFDPESGRLQGNFGGWLTKAETRAYYDRLRRLCPRVHADCYQNVVSAGQWTRVLREHPDWFRRLDREGNVDSLFPNWSYTFQTMFSHPACRAWMADMLASFATDTGSDICYTDETQQTNTIDWERDAVTRDDGSVRFWKLLKDRLHADGTMYFANGSGLPYVDLNYMESPHEMQPKRWRDWVGVALGIGMLNRLKPGNRTSPLYWSGGCDYVNRFLALGWVPAAPAQTRVLMPIRAAWQCGHMTPLDVACSPDWKTDPQTEIESHACVRRNCRDVVLSFINRGAAADVPVTVDLATLGFVPDERINVWKGHFDETRAEAEPALADRDLRANWRTEGAVDGASLYRPELVYSGPATGVLSNALVRLGKDRMEQFLVTAAPLQLFAADDIPLNQYYTTAKDCRIDGRTVRNARRVDVLLASLETGFADVTANGKPAEVRKIRLGGKAFDLVTLEPGTWQFGWRTVPREELAEVALPAAPKARVSAVAPLRAAGHEPEMRVTERADRSADGVDIVETYRWTTACEMRSGVLADLKPGLATIDLERLRMVAGASRREAVNTSTLFCWTGLRLRGAKRMKLRFSHTLQDTHASHLGYTYPWGWGTPGELFTGFVVDYHTKDGFAKRVSMSTGLFSDRSVAVFPWWGAAKNAPDSVNLTFGEWIEEAKPREFVLDLARFAPEDWDGETVFSFGEDKLGTGRRLELEILGFNGKAVGEEAVPRAPENIRDAPPPVTSKPLKAKPRSLNVLYSEEWDHWTKLPGKFTRLVCGAAKKGTTCYLAHDYESVYIGVKCEEDDRGPAAGTTAPYQNEHIEICVHRGDGKVIQYLGDVKGQVACYLDNVEIAPPKGTVCRGENCKAWHQGWRVFFAIPLDSLKPNMQRTPVEIRANICRDRKIGEREFTSWAPMEKDGVYDLPKYGTWLFDFNW